MKKYILILFSIISFWSCTEDESIDITVLPSVTTTGANTFGCLMDGWIYVGGRYLNWGHSYVWTYDSFHYYPEEDKLSVNVSVKPDINIHFIILSPQEGKEATLTVLIFIIQHNSNNGGDSNNYSDLLSSPALLEGLLLF